MTTPPCAKTMDMVKLMAFTWAKLYNYKVVVVQIGWDNVL